MARQKGQINAQMSARSSWSGGYRGGAAAATTVLTVGPSGNYQTIATAVAAANADTNPANDYVITIAPGTYTNDTAEVERQMTIQAAVPGSAVILNQTMALTNQKGILLKDAALTVDGLTFQGAEIDNSLGGNGAGIRDQDTGGGTLTVRNSTFINNQMGILTNASLNENLVLVNNLFMNNGNPNPSFFGHAVYIGVSQSLIATGNEVCGQIIGHDIKSRASVNLIEGNTLYDGAVDPNQPTCGAGSTSYALDLPNGGAATVVGNTMIQDTATQNFNMFAYGEEGLIYPTNIIVFMNNVMDNTVSGAVGILDRPAIPVTGNGNVFADSIAQQVNPASANQLTGTGSGGSCESCSPDGTTLTAAMSGSLTTAAGTWTFTSTQVQSRQVQILLNGNFVNGYAAEMEVAHGGNLYAFNSSTGNWWLWVRSGWQGVAAP
jgi:hypothetical protein